MPSKKDPMAPIFLVGYRCTGKTTVGRGLAKALACPFLDTDEKVQTLAGMSIAAMVAKKGWAYFRSMETRSLKELIADQHIVVATGGGIVLSEENRQLLTSKGTCIWLRADEATVIGRLLCDANSATMRPDLTDKNLETETRSMLELREPMYRDVSDMSLDTAKLSPEQCVEFILRRFNHDRL